MVKPILTHLLALFLLLAASAFAAAPSTITWTIAFDDSATVPIKEFQRYGEIARAAVLPFVRPGDDVFILRLAEEGVDALRMSTRLSRFSGQVTELHSRLCSIARRARGGYTDYERVLDHLVDQLRVQDQQRELLGARERILIFVTDGKPDSPVRSRPLEALPAGGVRFGFIGIHDGTEPVIRKVLARRGFTDEKRMLFHPISVWTGDVEALGRYYGRSPDHQAERALRGRSCTHPQEGK